MERENTKPQKGEHARERGGRETTTNGGKSLVLGYEVDRPSEFFIKTSNAMEYTELDIQNIEAPITNDLII